MVFSVAITIGRVLDSPGVAWIHNLSPAVVSGVGTHSSRESPMQRPSIGLVSRGRKHVSSALRLVSGVAGDVGVLYWHPPRMCLAWLNVFCGRRPANELGRFRFKR